MAICETPWGFENLILPECGGAEPVQLPCCGISCQFRPDNNNPFAKLECFGFTEEPLGKFQEEVFGKSAFLWLYDIKMEVEYAWSTLPYLVPTLNEHTQTIDCNWSSFHGFWVYGR